MKIVIFLLLINILMACQSAQPILSETKNVVAVRLIQYRDESGNGLIPVARNVGETRSKLWQRWLEIHKKNFKNQNNDEKIMGQTQWCVQWLGGEQAERICQRDDVLIWFGRGVLRDKTAILQAQKIWALR